MLQAGLTNRKSGKKNLRAATTIDGNFEQKGAEMRS